VNEQQGNVGKPRILYLYRYAILGGVTTQLGNRLNDMQRWSVPFFGFLQDFGGRSVFNRYPHTAVFSPLDRLAKYVQDHPPDLIVVIDTPEVYPVLHRAGYVGPILNEVHTTTANLQYLTDLRSDPPMTALAAPSEYLRNRILDEYRYKNVRPVFVIPNGLDTTLFRPISTISKFERPLLAWVGKLDEHKNWRQCLTIVKRLSSQTNFEAWIVGGYTASERTREEFIRLIDKEGLTAQVRWIPYIAYHFMPRLYSVVAKSGGLCLSTSTDESFGMSILESLACGCPVVAPAVGAIPELLRDDLTSYLYEPGSVESALAAVQRICSNLHLRQRLIDCGRETASTRYGIAQLSVTHRAVVQKLLSRAWFEDRETFSRKTMKALEKS
jgi:glycosyltransferase involved in cell wall biosynthesis